MFNITCVCVCVYLCGNWKRVVLAPLYPLHTPARSFTQNLKLRSLSLDDSQWWLWHVRARGGSTAVSCVSARDGIRIYKNGPVYLFFLFHSTKKTSFHVFATVAQRCSAITNSWILYTTPKLLLRAFCYYTILLPKIFRNQQTIFSN